MPEHPQHQRVSTPAGAGRRACECDARRCRGTHAFHQSHCARQALVACAPTAGEDVCVCGGGGLSVDVLGGRRAAGRRLGWPAGVAPPHQGCQPARPGGLGPWLPGGLPDVLAATGRGNRRRRCRRLPRALRCRCRPPACLPPAAGWCGRDGLSGVQRASSPECARTFSVRTVPVAPPVRAPASQLSASCRASRSSSGACWDGRGGCGG